MPDNYNRNNQGRGNFQPGGNRDRQGANQAIPNRPPQTARAPYNFVPLPKQVVEAEALPDHDKYDNLSGYFEVTLTTETPLYIRGMLTEKEARESEKHKNKCNFFAYSDQPVIPGSSLRGMLRNLVEIVTFGKITQVSNKPKIFFRAVAAKTDDPLGEDYKDIVGTMGAKIRAGYLEKEADNWFIRPAKPYRGKTFAKVQDIDRFGTISGEIPKLSPKVIHLNEGNYVVQYHDVIVRDETLAEGQGGLRCNVREPRAGENHRSVLVCTGNMAESSDVDNRGRVKTQRKNFTVVFEADANAEPIKIAAQAVTDYLEGLTPFQKEAPFDEKYGCLVAGRPVFYVALRAGGPIQYFGHAPFFRVPAVMVDSTSGTTRAVTPKDFIPAGVGNNLTHYDIAEAMFGYVGKGDKNGKQGEKSQSYASRISVSDARVIEGQKDFYEPIFTPKILGGPKPTTFQHYLEQPKGKDTPKSELNHYGDKSTIRGHKLYWRQQNVTVADVKEDEANLTEEATQKEDTQHTRMQPVKPGISFSFRVHFDNLSEVELGVLAWVLSLPGSDEYRHQLGMGKPLGMGVVKLAPRLYLINREQRYKTLFGANGWEEAVTESNADQCIRKFEQHICKAIGHRGKFQHIVRINELLTMLQPRAIKDKFNYMQIEGKNEYTERPVLPKPSDLFPPSEPLPAFSFMVGEVVQGRIVKQAKPGENYQVKLDDKYGSQIINLTSDNKPHSANSETWMLVEEGNDQNNLGVAFKHISKKEAESIRKNQE